MGVSFGFPMKTHTLKSSFGWAKTWSGGCLFQLRALDFASSLPRNLAEPGSKFPPGGNISPPKSTITALLRGRVSIFCLVMSSSWMKNLTAKGEGVEGGRMELSLHDHFGPGSRSPFFLRVSHLRDILPRASSKVV